MNVYSVIYTDPREGDFETKMENFTSGASQRKRFNELRNTEGVIEPRCEDADFTLNKAGVMAAIEYGKSCGEVKPDTGE